MTRLTTFDEKPEPLFPIRGNELRLSLMAASTISGAQNLSSKRSQILATPHVGSELNPQYTVLLSYFNSSSGVLPIINKLPYNIQEKWTMRAANYKKQHSVPFPPFSLVLNQFSLLPSLDVHCS
jgi:hypothetical protein